MFVTYRKYVLQNFLFKPKILIRHFHVVNHPYEKMENGKLEKSRMYAGQTTIGELSHRIALDSVFNDIPEKIDHVLSLDIDVVGHMVNTVLERLERVESVILQTYSAHLYYGFGSGIGTSNRSNHNDVGYAKKIAVESGRRIIHPIGSIREYDIAQEFSNAEKEGHKQKTFQQDFDKDHQQYIKTYRDLRDVATDCLTGWKGYEEWVSKLPSQMVPRILWRSPYHFDVDDEEEWVVNDEEDWQSGTKPGWLITRKTETTPEEVEKLISIARECYDIQCQIILQHLPGRTFLNKL